MPTPPPPSESDYLNLCNTVYTVNGASPPLTITLSGVNWTRIKFTPQTTTSAMQAVAYQNTATGQVVIAYEGTNTSNLGVNNAMLLAQAVADNLIYSGTTPGSNSDALTFAQQVVALAGGNPIYVTGHSLGGEEAQFVAASGITGFSGGATFGAPGVPQTSASNPNNFINYVDAGDRIGNFVPGGGARIGVVQPVGDPFDAFLEQLAMVGGDYVDGDGYAAGLAIADHLLIHYANDLNVTLASAPANSTDQGSADVVTWGSANGVFFHGALSTPQVVAGNLVVNGDTLSKVSGVTALTLNNGHRVDIVTGAGASINVPTTAPLAIVNSLLGNSANTVEIINKTLGTTTFIDLLGNPFASYAPGQLNGGTVKVNGDEIDAYTSGNVLVNSTKKIKLGSVSGVLDKTYATFTDIHAPWTTQGAFLSTVVEDINN